jgi:hypothetical protein
MNIQTEYYINSGYYIAVVDDLDHHLPGYGWVHGGFRETDAWCEQTFGPSDIWGDPPVTGWKRMFNKYYFVDQSTLNWFVMRWS